LLYQSLRNTTTSEVQGLGNVLNDLAEIGIYPGSIGGFDDSKEGYLLLAPTGEDDYEETIRDYLSSDTDLMEALTNNADKVYDLFAVEGTSDTGEDTGIARQLDSLLGSYIDSEGILDEKVTSGGSLEEEISRLSDRIETEEERLKRLEERLWAQFTAMEEQISKLNAQASSVTALLESSGVNSSLV
jgi:flagellar capping protein FliD